ncbi:unnamed protein product [[Actinomadura] parvosata subsp. kistnae]|uniref:Uncharacterized protein n=1 Tax=[Actinomadura] parvosata subsp. kistnae TaxID=1909395 RepID=A0A1U9ZW80_9ACTN|nr:hypothetical protein [Nonomuraea sp. ATCC 55076]AQZ62192.1 hypothetical protein BKM31_12580 [Nonomuraea sp. ATCC 55076]SPL95954.1 unnamed protein product [Actinomadura parvosata subsp. kistnae]
MGVDDLAARTDTGGARHSRRLAEVRAIAREVALRAADIRADSRRNAAIAQELCRTLAEQRARLRAAFTVIAEQRQARRRSPG